MPSWLSRQDYQAVSVLLVLSTAVYLNTLQAGFTFDDNFAVVGLLAIACIQIQRMFLQADRKSVVILLRRYLMVMSLTPVYQYSEPL